MSKKLTLMNELELAAFELSEAETHEKQSKALRKRAIQRVATAHRLMKDALMRANQKGGK